MIKITGSNYQYTVKTFINRAKMILPTYWESILDPVVVFGKILRALRREASLTQEQLAFKAGVERNFISLIERGVNQPTVKVIFKLATALNTKPSKILALVEIEVDRNS